LRPAVSSGSNKKQKKQTNKANQKLPNIRRYQVELLTEEVYWVRKTYKNRYTHSILFCQNN